MFQAAKKRVVVLSISILTIEAYKDAYTFFAAKNTLLPLLNIFSLKCVPYIYYLI